jgi:hypothetical protein
MAVKKEEPVRDIWIELEHLGYNEKQIEELFILIENLPVHYVSDNAKKVRVVIAKGHIVVI